MRESIDYIIQLNKLHLRRKALDGQIYYIKLYATMNSIWGLYRMETKF